MTRGQLQKRELTIEALLLANEERGKDSTGIAAIKKGKLSLLKQVVPAGELIQSNWLNGLLGNSCKILIGHTRHATQGAKTVDNAHPFHIGSIIGAHNGTISNYQDLSTQEVEVDSQAVFSQLDSQKNNYKEVLAQVVGTCALSWIDLNQPVNAYFVSHQNPLAMARVKGIDTIFWSSLKTHLRVVLQAVFGNAYEIWDLKPDYVYCILSKLQIKKQPVKFGEAAEKKEEEKKEEEKKSLPLLAPVETLGEEEKLVKQAVDHRKHHFYRKLSYLDGIDDEYKMERTHSHRQLSFLRDKVTMKERAIYEGCDVCSKPIYKYGYYSVSDKGLICLACRTKPQYANYGQEVKFA